MFLQASELTYAYQMAAANTGSSSLSAVIVVPPHFGPHQRRALLDAAEIARMPVLALMQSHAAAALQYGIERDFGGRKEHIILYDVGSSDVVAALVEYSAYNVSGPTKHLSQFAVRDITWQEDSGAGRLDVLLMQHLAAEFEAQNEVQGILQHSKVAAKLRKSVQRTKEMLSANIQAPFYVEELHGGIDFSTSVTRSKLEELAGEPKHNISIQQSMVEFPE
jgi:hypoxia up-regulated 1